MNIELRNFIKNDAFSRETLAFTANVILNGHFIGHAASFGTGAAILFTETTAAYRWSQELENAVFDAAGKEAAVLDVLASYRHKMMKKILITEGGKLSYYAVKPTAELIAKAKAKHPNGEVMNEWDSSRLRRECRAIVEATWGKAHV